MKNSKILLLVILGIVFWFTGAMSVKFLGSSVFSESNPYRILFFALLFPISYIFIYISIKIAKLEKSEIFYAVAIMTMVATLLDGSALTWFSQLYADSHEVAHYGAAWILWGAGVGLLLAYFMTERKN